MKIETGEINNKQLLELFGTQKQKDNFIKEKKLNSGSKKRILEKAKRYCEIEDLTQGKYLIHKVYNIKNEQYLLPLFKGLSKYLTPLILIKLLEDQDENYKITLPYLTWAKNFEMINQNYPLLKSHQKAGSIKLNIDKYIIFDYFEKMDECIKYYLEKCLTILGDKKGLDLIDFDSITMVRKAYFDNILQDNIAIFDGNTFDEPISDEDRKFVIDCENTAKDIAGIIDNQEKYYGKKSYIYKNKLRELLAERNIAFTYSAYNIYCKNPKEIKNIIEQFMSILSSESNNMIQVFNDAFIEYINNKAISRQNREIDKFNENERIIKKYRLAETYVSDFKVLSDLTVRHNAKELMLDLNNIEDIINEYNNYSINININKINEKENN